MNIEDIRDFALSLNEQVTEELFAEEWNSWETVSLDATRRS